MTKKETNMLLYLVGGTGLLLLLTRTFEKVTSNIMDKKTFLTSMKPIADRIKVEYGIQPIITMTQSALESNWGSSGLTKIANNLFGVKASSSWTGEVVVMPTKEYDKTQNKTITIEQTFRKYPNWYSSVKNWAELIKNNFSSAYEYAKSGDVLNYAKALRKGKYGSYATDPKYEEKIQNFAKMVVENMEV